ncbi:MAG TPA: gamma-glutamylcyclotransferase [Casimicrobiaceae bacterium]|nr:gamma-glutamylcyclotransferase [Casimicrobiaceae bacterium]
MSDKRSQAVRDIAAGLSRRDLENGRMRQIYIDTCGDGRALNDEQLSASLTTTLAAKPKGAGWWVFGYGSLLWNPIFPIAEARPALLRGLHRNFCLWSLASRGTLQAPGLVLALTPGGSCKGVAYRLPAPLAIDELHLLWRREMVTGGYAPKWVKLEAQGRTIVGLAFTVKREHPQYAGELSLQAQADVIASACGHLGTSQDYLERTRTALVSHGIVDSYLEKLAMLVGDRCRGQLATSSSIETVARV